MWDLDHHNILLHLNRLLQNCQLIHQLESKKVGVKKALTYEYLAFERIIVKQTGGFNMKKKRVIIPFVFAMSLGVSAVHADEVKTSTNVSVETSQKQAKVQKPQQLKDLQAEIKTLREQKAQLNTQIKSAYQLKVVSLKQEAKLIQSAKDKTKAEKKVALTDIKSKLTALKNEHKAYSTEVKKLWEDRKSKWETFKGNLKDRDYDISVNSLKMIKANLIEAIKLKQEFLSKITN